MVMLRDGHDACALALPESVCDATCDSGRTAAAFKTSRRFMMPPCKFVLFLVSLT
jgi:hypothetical protein